MSRSTGVGRGNNPQSWGHHLSGPAHPRWNDESRMIGSNGYVKLRVGREHPLADPNGYAYEHLVVWVSAGNPRPAPGWLIHHKDEIKTNNRLSNFELKRRSRHSVEHMSPLSDRQVRGMRWRYAVATADTMQLGKLYNVPFQTVWKIVKGKTRADAGGPIQTGSLRGKKAAGRTLDGAIHDARPEVRSHG